MRSAPQPPQTVAASFKDASRRTQARMVEFWRDLPGTVGHCPYSLEELRSLVEPIGPRRFVFIRHGPRGVRVGRWDTAELIEGEWGNLIFVTDRLVDAAEAVLPAIERSLADRHQRPPRRGSR